MAPLGMQMSNEKLDYVVGTTSIKNLVKTWEDTPANRKADAEWKDCHNNCLLAAPAVDKTVREMWRDGLFVYATFHDETCPNRGWRLVINEQGGNRVKGGDASLQKAEELGFFAQEDE